MSVLYRLARRLQDRILESYDPSFTISSVKMASFRGDADALASVVLGMVENGEPAPQIIRTVGQLEALADSGFLLPDTPEPTRNTFDPDAGPFWKVPLGNGSQTIVSLPEGDGPLHVSGFGSMSQEGAIKLAFTLITAIKHASTGEQVRAARRLLEEGKK